MKTAKWFKSRQVAPTVGIKSSGKMRRHGTSAVQQESAAGAASVKAILPRSGAPRRNQKIFSSEAGSNASHGIAAPNNSTESRRLNPDDGLVEQRIAARNAAFGIWKDRDDAPHDGLAYQLEVRAEWP